MPLPHISTKSPSTEYSERELIQFRSALKTGDNPRALGLLQFCPTLATVADRKDRTALHLAGRGRCGDEVIRFLIELEAPASALDYRDRTPLHCAVWGKTPVSRTAIHRLLCAMDPNAINQQDKDGRTALMVAASRGHIRAVEALLDADADLDATRFEQTFRDLIDKTWNSLRGARKDRLGWIHFLRFLLAPLAPAVGPGALIRSSVVLHRRKGLFGKTALEIAAIRRQEAAVDALQIAYRCRGKRPSDQQLRGLEHNGYHPLSEEELVASNQFKQYDVEAKLYSIFEKRRKLRQDLRELASERETTKQEREKLDNDRAALERDRRTLEISRSEIEKQSNNGVLSQIFPNNFERTYAIAELKREILEKDLAISNQASAIADLERNLQHLQSREVLLKNTLSDTQKIHYEKLVAELSTSMEV